MEGIVEYSKFLQNLEEYGRFLEHLKGVDERVGNVTEKLSEISDRVAGSVKAAGDQITKSMESLVGAAGHAEEIAKQLQHLGSVALRAQRDSVRAHDRLLIKINKADHDQDT
jgi:hypothetical protein